MSSVPNSFVVGSYSTASGVAEAFHSYRRSQFYYLDSAVSATPTDDEADYDEEACSDEEDDREPRILVEDTGSDEGESSETFDNLAWDEDLTPTGQPAGSQGGRLLFPRPPLRRDTDTDRTVVPRPRSPTMREDAPLLHKSTSLTFAEPPARAVDGAHPPAAIPEAAGPSVSAVVRRTSYGSIHGSAGRRGSNASRAAKAAQLGKSTFGQTLFNAIAVLLGIGMLSEPLAFAYAGWIGGMALMIFYGFITCYTAKILAHFIMDDAKLRSYSDIGRKAFGPRSGPLISTLFCLELFTVSIALVTLFGDSLHSILPLFASNTYKLMGLAIIVPTVLMPLSVLSYASVVGILSTVFLVVVMFIDGLSRKESPGSLWHPAPTSLNPGNLGELGLAFGLLMAGFSGHAVIPSLAKDMIDPSQFDHMINWAFGIASLIYTTIGVTGYLMFGNNVSDEFSQDLMRVPGYNPLLNRIAMWGLVLVPISKFALATRPLNVTIEIILGIDTGSQSPDDHGVTVKTSPSVDDTLAKTHSRLVLKQIFTVVERTLVTVLAVVVSIVIPEFDAIMAFLGSFSAFLICVIGPVLAKGSLTGRLTFWDVVLLVIAVIMAGWGTGAAFWSAA